MYILNCFFFCECRRDSLGVVLSGLLLGFFIRARHNISHSNGILRRWRVTNRCHETEKSLYKQHHVLHRHPVPAAPRLFILIYRI